MRHLQIVSRPVRRACSCAVWDKGHLVLINGRRMANYGFAQNLQDTYVDLNSIPNSAIERVEVLRDGASGHLWRGRHCRRDQHHFAQGLQRPPIERAVGGTRYEKGMNEYRTSVTAGVGDLARDRYNVLGVVDYFSRDMLTRPETSWLRDGSNTQFPGGTLSGWISGVATLQVGAGPNGFGGRWHLSLAQVGP